VNKFQKCIKQYADDRDWDQFHNPKDLLLGIVEEIGEIRNIVKWEQDPKKIKKVLADNKAELEDNIGDIYWFLALLANGSGINIDNAINGVIKNNEKRFPVKDVKSKHTNRYLGGKDKQYDG
jgi:NTP pyrophosphatase (non-canonical NTP hydrolase)